MVVAARRQGERKALEGLVGHLRDENHAAHITAWSEDDPADPLSVDARIVIDGRDICGSRLERALLFGGVFAPGNEALQTPFAGLLRTTAYVFALLVHVMNLGGRERPRDAPRRLTMTEETRGAGRRSEPAIRSFVPSRFAGALRLHRPGQMNRSVGSSSVGEGQEHDGRLARGETVRRSGLHVQPEAGSRVELLTVREELEPAFDNLHDG